MSDQSRGRALPSRFAFPVVGIAASADDIEALSEFFQAMPESPDAAFVVILQAPTQPQHTFGAALQRAVGMPVVSVEKTIALEPNHIYVAEPPHLWTVAESELRSRPADGADERRKASFVFFDSLATAYGERAIGVAFAGADPDGATGFMRLKEFGGITFAQDSNQPRPDGPAWPLDAGNAIDVELAAGEMPRRMLDLWANAKKIRLTRLSQDDEQMVEPGVGTANDERTLREIMMILRNRTTHDFRHYKRATVLRRLERRMQVNGLSDLQQYRDYLQAHPEETAALLQDMLISVTNFFRDKEAFDVLADRVLPSLFAQRRPDEPVRAWVVGCATGEEAYTVAMLLQEAASREREPVAFQVFATDISERAIATARDGLYPASIAADVGADRLRQFFMRDGEHYRVKKALRERVLFALHNVLSDPPFSRLDLVCCRNMLIYLDREAQTDTLRTFHFALRPGAHLFLGSSETADSASSLFADVDKKARIYRASLAARIDTPVPFTTPGVPNMRPAVAQLQRSGRRKFSFGELHQRVVEQHAPPSVLINRDSDIVHLSERAGRFLQYVGGEPSHNILTVVHPELRLELRSAIYQALQTDVSVDSRPIRLERDGRSFIVKMTARPVNGDDGNPDFVLVLFDEVQEGAGGYTLDVNEAKLDDQRDPIISQLERELQQTREQLQATIEQSETSTEELKASNEELQAINEELRSATEELETSKEELQAINEELTTVNAELNAKVKEASKINDDLQNLIVATDIATIFVDRTLTIKRYTPRAADVFNIIATDTGRSLLDIAHRLKYDKLAADAAEAFGSLRLIEQELESTDGRWYLARILPYRTTENRIDGAVLTFIDISARRAAEERLRNVGHASIGEAERRRDEFLAVVSHELKHPLNLISASTELIGRSQEVRANSTLARAADTIRRTVLGQAQIIDDLLDMSRMRTGKLSITRRPVDFKEVVQRICHTVQDEAERKDIDFRLSVPDGPVSINADLTRIEQVVWNLVSNALKFTDGDGKIAVRLSLDEQHALLAVTDNGVGIDPAALPHIFEMFEQSRSSVSAVRGGLGIGLSLVKDLVAIHGGDVQAHSDGIGRGATFTVKLPRVVETIDNRADGAYPTTFLKGERVLLIDDDQDTVETFKLLLEMEGAIVTTATSGEEGLDLLGKHMPSLILSDLGMPGMSGLAFIEAVRRDPRFDSVRAIALSGFGRASDVDEATQAGFDGHLTKPVMLDALLSTIARMRTK